MYETQIRSEMFNKLESTKYHSLTQQLISTTYSKSVKGDETYSLKTLKNDEHHTFHFTSV